MVNFFNEEIKKENGEYVQMDCFDKTGSSKVWERSIKIEGKSVKADWQHEIAEYLESRHWQLTN